MANAKPDWTIQPDIKPIKAFHFPKKEVMHLSNGIPLTVIPDGGKGAFRLDVVFGCGLVDQSKLLQASTTCRMLREGTSRHSSKELADNLDFYGAWLETSTYFLYSRITLYSLTKYADATIPLVAELVKNATFPSHEFTVVNSSNKAYSRVVAAKTNVKALRALLAGLFGQRHICGCFAADGDYDALSVGDLKRFHRDFYTSSNCNLFFSGDLSDTLLSQIEDAFGKDNDGWSETALPTRIRPVSHTTDERRICIDCPTASQNSVRMGCFLMPRSHPDFLFSSFFNTLFGGFFGSRLMGELRENKGYTYGISSTVSMYPFDNVLVISSETSVENTEKLIEGVYHEIHRLKTELVRDDELSLVKNYYLSDLYRTYEEPLSIADYCINMQYLGLPYDCQEKAVQLALEATPQQVRDFACKWLAESGLREVVAGKIPLKQGRTE